MSRGACDAQVAGQGEGKDRYSTEIVATEMQMLGSRGGAGGGAGHGIAAVSRARRQPVPGRAVVPRRRGGDDAPFDDDIPF